ncbi:2-iminoacetate synthase ThiH [Luteococcus sediminum]
MARPGVLDHFSGQEQSDGSRRRQVLAARERASFDAVTDQDVARVLAKGELDEADIAVLLSPAAGRHLEALARRARQLTRERFGNSVHLFSPLYVANHCANACTYCGFTATARIQRARLDGESLDAEFRALAEEGIEEVLILTGESPKFSPVDYVAHCVERASGFFATVGIEVQPMNTDDYRRIHRAGAEHVCVYQETYDLDRYEQVHLGGRKRSFAYRFDSQERALLAGMRGVAFGALLGLADPRRDALATLVHARSIQRDFPHAEIMLSCPRIRPTGTDTEAASDPVDERLLLQILCAYRLATPQASITVSTRERPGFRDAVAGLVATKLSASVSTGVGHHVEEAPTGDEQFEISDERSLAEVVSMLRATGLQPVLNDNIRLAPAGG